eukprot:6005-Eustigmatos_ZCMA.PRE.1
MASLATFICTISFASSVMHPDAALAKEREQVILQMLPISSPLDPDIHNYSDLLAALETAMMKEYAST